MTDSEIRNMLLSAEESVSPAAWDAVAKGLDAKKKLVPFWMWSAVAVAAAAAVVMGIFLFKPRKQGLENYSNMMLARISSPLSADIVTPEVSAGISRFAAMEPKRENQALEAVECTDIEPEALLKQDSGLALPPKSSYTPSVDDNSLLNRLAFEETPLPGMDISLTTSGNVQASGKGHAFSRRSASAGATTVGEGISNPSQDKPGIPLSAGIGVRWNITHRLAIGTGARYTNMRRSFVGDYHSGEGYDLKSCNIDNMQHWIGIPINVYFDVVRQPRFRVHVFGGGGVDYIMYNKFTIHNKSTDIFWVKKDACFQWSVSAGAGMEYMLTPHIGLYLDPSLRYFFNQAGADINGLPAVPFRFSLEAGLRFSLGSY